MNRVFVTTKPYTNSYSVSEQLQAPLLEFIPNPVVMRVPLFASKVPAGFPSPADDHLEAALDLNSHYIRNPTATFFVRVQGQSMIGAGIYDNDLLVVDRSLEAKSGAIVIAVVNNELTVKRLLIRDDGVFLMPENPVYAPIQLNDFMELHVWGVVAHVIHSF